MVRGMSVRRTWLAVAIVSQSMLAGAPAGAQGDPAAPSPAASGTKGPGVSLAEPVVVGFDGREFSGLPAIHTRRQPRHHHRDGARWRHRRAAPA